MWVAFPDFSTELISIGESGGGLVTYRWVMRGTNTGPGQTELCDLNRDMSHTRLDSVENRKLYIL